MKAAAVQNTQVLYIDRRGIGVEMDVTDRLAAERHRCAALIQDATPPEQCGWLIPAAPARGGFEVFMPEAMVADAKGDRTVQTTGYAGRHAIRAADVFDRMLVAAKRRKQDAPLTPGQVAMARRYRDLAELLASDGTKLSRLETSFGGGDSAGWMDRRLMLSDEMRRLHRAIGPGMALSVRRIRPSARGADQRGPIHDRAMVDMVCLHGLTLDQVLLAHGWVKDGRTYKAITEALCAALDRMIGYRDEKSC
ncbi:hypothetical protein [Paracoccus yeei]|uniref:Uncharacterized protein n=1 Tax=Paracoccus yeei TaxID=147645 RepID=A0A5P2QRR4_9RHOB|nr:hypothetical protein [Paracoccus yeei]QEU08757.1 hypothetical protein FOB51_12565 [Paracoccus yeei]